jgi:hypothetical protein
VTETHEERIARLKREHTDKMAKLKADGEARVREIYERHRDRCAEWDLSQQFRREEEGIRKRNEDAVTLAYKRTGRTYRKHLGLPTTVKDAADSLADLIESHRVFVDDPQVAQLREWFTAVAATHRIDVREDAAPQLRNGSAVPKLRRVTIAPIQSLETAAVAAHELGHVLGDMDPHAPWKLGEFGIGRICPSDEVNAWRWVLKNTPVWLPPMHERMAQCLASYRPDATPDEAGAIDEVCSNISFRLTQLRIMKTQ